MHDLPNYPELHGSPPSFPAIFSLPCAACSICQTPCGMPEFTEGMKKPAGKMRQVVCWCVAELSRLTAGSGKGQGRAGWTARQEHGWKVGKGKKSSQLDSDHAPSWCPKPGAAPSPLAPSLPAWLVTRDLGEPTPCLLSIPSYSHHGTIPSLSAAPWLHPALWSWVSLPAEPFQAPEPLPAPHFPGAELRRWLRGGTGHPRASPPCLLPSPGVWKLSATSWLPQIHMGRGS